MPIVSNDTLSAVKKIKKKIKKSVVQGLPFKKNPNQKPQK